jgi:hypothetical protein
MTMLIRGARVLTLDTADTEYAWADILIEDGTIIAVGPDLEAPPFRLTSAPRWRRSVSRRWLS